MSHSYKSLDNAIATVKELGDSIVKDGLPDDFNPMTFVFTGNGNVSKGAQHIFQNLPHENINPKDLKECVSDKHKFSNKKIYGCQVKLEDYLIRKDTGKFVSKSDYYSNPDKYLSEFHSKIAPYTSMLIHGSYWDTKFPRLITTKQLREIQSNPTIKNRLLCISDISCDINGALEFLSHSTKIDDPFYYVDAVNNKEHKSDDGQGTQIMAVDILPTEIPLESSKHFKNNPVLSSATIAKDGKLMDRHKNLYNLLPKSTINSTSTATATASTETGAKKVTINNHIKKKILLLGSGFVAKPFVDYLSAKNDLDLVIASNAKEEAIALTHGNPNIQIVNLDVNNKQDLSGLVERSDVVVSFIPAPLHPIVAEQCILHGKHMITASYISPEMKALDERAKQANITILNEIGVDPGIDHLSAMKVIDEVRDEGGEITSFISWCGGLPAPEASNVPLGYKFSWSPKGVLTAALNDAKFWMNGRYQEIPGGDLLKSHFPSVLTYPGFAFEGLANRNSLSYIDTYGLSPLETKKAMFRGTLRYKGYSDLMYSFYKLGLLDTKPFKNSNLCNWSDFFDNLLFNKLNGNGNMMTMITESDRITAISEKLNLAKDHYMIDQDIISSSSIAPIDLFCTLLQQKLKYSSHERDLLVLHHEFGIKLKNGQDVGIIRGSQIKTSSLVSYGSLDTYTAMAKTVGLPSAIAAEMVARGILSPTTKSTYLPILEKLENEGIKIVENVECHRKETSQKLECSGSGIWN
ncbi:5576_t:CDS:10 [Entrophospora sp. SA101]|nr:5576_t:CDS:10 [Entrophospora sp. SA101]